MMGKPFRSTRPLVVGHDPVDPTTSSNMETFDGPEIGRMSKSKKVEGPT